MAVLTPELQQRWDADGWCVVPGVIPPAELAQQGGSEAGEWHTWDAPWPEFPFHSSRLNALVLSERVVEPAEGLLGSADLALYMGILTAKYARQASGYNQLLHADYPNHMLVVPRHEPGYQQVEFFVYLTDVTVEDGATRFSWQKTKDIPVERHTLNYVDDADLYDDPSDASAPAGSIVAYPPDVYHRSSDSPTPPATASYSMSPSVTAKPAGAAIRRGRSAASRPSSRNTSNRRRRGNSRSWVCPIPAIPTGTTRRWPASRPAIPASK